MQPRHRMNGVPKHAVVTLCVGDAFGRLASISHPLMEEYARRIGAAFEVIREAPKEKEPHFAKSVLSALLNRYERIVYIDSDILVAPDCPNLFELVAPEKFGAFHESDLFDRTHSIRSVQEALGDINWRNGYFNTGVMVASRQHGEVFASPFGLFSDPWFLEQTLFNYNCRRLGIPLKRLHFAFNFIVALSVTTSLKLTPYRFGMHMIHYAGPSTIRDAREGWMTEDAIEIMRLRGRPMTRFLLRCLGQLKHYVLPLVIASWHQIVRSTLRRMQNVYKRIP
jgi:hypothetical protein